jgi:hypothetical protein
MQCEYKTAVRQSTCKTISNLRKRDDDQSYPVSPFLAPGGEGDEADGEVTLKLVAPSLSLNFLGGLEPIRPVATVSLCEPRSSFFLFNNKPSSSSSRRRFSDARI